MRRGFFKGMLVSIVAYTTAVLAGFAIDFRLTLFAVPILLVTWTLFCTVRVIQLRFGSTYHPDALPYAQESYGFSLGGSLSSFVLLCAIIVLSQSG